MSEARAGRRSQRARGGVADRRSCGCACDQTRAARVKRMWNASGVDWANATVTQHRQMHFVRRMGTGTTVRSPSLQPSERLATSQWCHSRHGRAQQTSQQAHSSLSTPLHSHDHAQRREVHEEQQKMEKRKQRQTDETAVFMCASTSFYYTHHLLFVQIQLIG